MLSRDSADNDRPKQEVERLANHAQQWISSPAGRQSLSESLRVATEVTEQLQEARRVDPKILQERATC